MTLARGAAGVVVDVGGSWHGIGSGVIVHHGKPKILDASESGSLLSRPSASTVHNNFHTREASKPTMASVIILPSFKSFPEVKPCSLNNSRR